VAIGLEEKKAIVAEVNETAASALSLVVADARGVASNDMTALRATARENQVICGWCGIRWPSVHWKEPNTSVSLTHSQVRPCLDFLWKIQAQQHDCSRISPRTTISSR
jgi:hypothetical protein